MPPPVPPTGISDVDWVVSTHGHTDHMGYGVSGNMSLEEAVEFLSRGLVGEVLGHYFGLFDFNTVDLESAERDVSTLPERLRSRVQLAALGKEYRLGGET